MARCFYVLGRAGVGRRTRCKYIHVSSMAPSMAPTVPPPHPAQPSRFFPRRTAKALLLSGGGRGVRSLFLRKRDLTPEAVGCCLCFCTLFFDLPWLRTRKLSGAGAVGSMRGVRGMGPRHASGGLGRTPNPGLAVCAGQRTRASRGQAPGMVHGVPLMTPPPRQARLLL